MLRSDRRQFLMGMIAATSLPSPSWADAGAPAYIAAARDGDNSYALFGLTSAGDDVFRIPLPGRGHAACAHPTIPEAVAFARRPGTYAIVIDCITGAATTHISAPQGHHFNGHGIFLSDGDTLCTPENDFTTGRGVLGFWSRKAGYRRIGQTFTGGIGPHDAKRLPNSDVLVVANGGILTHPDQGREKLNLDTMRPSLAYIDPARGLVEQIELDPELHQNSIRHLDIHPDGTVAFAMQWQGDIDEVVPLLGLHKRGHPPRLLEAPMGVQLAMKGYAGSVSYTASGGTVAITSPRGGLVQFYSAQGDYIGKWHRRDVCGLRAMGATGEIGTTGTEYLASDGNGALHQISPESATPLAVRSRAWDNHIVSL